jgi:transcriptional regulator with XRE-family HTH domain
MKQDSMHIIRRRREFGVYLRRLRHERALTCEELAEKVGNISRSALATIERGKRQAGAKVSERLADALKLDGEERGNFLVAALKTTSSEVLPQEAAGLDPEFYLPIWKMLAGHLIKPDDIKRISNQAKLTSESSNALKEAAVKLAAKAEMLAQQIRAALNSAKSPFMLDLEVETRVGKIVIVEILTGRSR